MTEPIRLVVWDLDETFWHGTLTEGGIRIRPENCRLVVELARRGIMSSICSKNVYEDVRAVLVEHEVWDYFVFPSINWEPKGPRIATLVEQVQLRPSTIMFIDDNPLNLQEALHFVPDLQVRGDAFIAEMAADPLFAGKDDSGLKRLAQYKLLERRKADESAAGHDVTEFLRSSQIKVELERDIEPHIDRVVELINRTNQLNFTKTRLSEDPGEARRQALEMFRRYNMQVALVHVSDRYGDHGFSGFYAYNSEARWLQQFCFSCRILGMGVEHWLYDRLGRPGIGIKGEVLSDLRAPRGPVTWINQAGINQAVASGDATPAARLDVDRLVAHGGCDLAAVAHYFVVHGVEVVPEFNLSRSGMPLRTDHSVFLGYAGQGLSPAAVAAAKLLCYAEEDFRSTLFEAPVDGQCLILSFASDGHHALYRHRATGIRLPCMMGLGPVFHDARSHEVGELPHADQNGPRGQALLALKSEFEFDGLISEAAFKANVLPLLERTRGADVFVLRPQEYHLNTANGQKIPAPTFVNLNRWTAEVAADFDNVEMIDIAEFAESMSEVENILHYDRKVYFRLYEYIVRRLAERHTKPVAAFA